MTNERPAAFSHRPGDVFASEWRLLIACASLTFVVANSLFFGWAQGILPSLDYPYTYAGDGLSHSWLAKRAAEGWIFNNSHSGYPFGSNFLDYPGSDTANLLVIKFLGLLTGTYYGAMNLYVSLAISAAFVSAFVVLRAIGLDRPLAVSGGFLYAISPFFFIRSPHLFYAAYFVAPIFTYIAFCVYFPQKESSTKNNLPRALWRYSAYIALASFGIYYAAFGVVTVLFAGAAASLRRASFQPIVLAMPVILFVTLGAALNLAPNILHRHDNGTNAEVAQRHPSSSEVYGLKLIQMILPRFDHRFSAFGSLTRNYEASAPLVNENKASALGVVATFGLTILFLTLVASSTGRQLDERLVLLSGILFILFMLGTIGGLGAIFANFVSPAIRAWNRVSIFISFVALAGAFLALQLTFQRYLRKNYTLLVVVAAATTGFAGFLDQTTGRCATCDGSTKAAFLRDQQFIQAIERGLPDGSAIYQLPYIPFPESPPLHHLHSYDLLVGFLHSKSLKWSAAGMKGRDGDLFYRALAKEPIEKQIRIVRKLGFNGIYVDRRGYQDNGKTILVELQNFLGPALVTRSDDVVHLFKVRDSLAYDPGAKTPQEIMEDAGFVADAHGERYSADLLDGIDFTRAGLPSFLRKITGLSQVESWGRWSDANLAQSVRFDFSKPLPRRFTLIIEARAYGPNTNKDAIVRIGTKRTKIRFSANLDSVRIPVDLDEEQAREIEVVAPTPVSPKSLGRSQDGRRIGIGFVRMKFEF